MKSRRVRMSQEEFHQLPFSLVWKQEYLNGCLVHTPRGVIVHATIPIAPRLVESPASLRPTKEADERALLPLFKDAFQDTFEFCDYSKKRFAESAKQCLHHFFHGPFHLPLPASRVAVAPSGAPEAGKPIGAALVLKQDEGWALLDMIFVKPAWYRHGLASALAAAALTALHELGGYRTLVSRYHLGNEPSCAWHHHFGFTDEPDLRLARLRLHAASHELRRLRELRLLTQESQRLLNAEQRRWQKEANRLEKLAREGREEEADPWRKWRRKARDDEKVILLNPAARL